MVKMGLRGFFFSVFCMLLPLVTASMWSSFIFMDVACDLFISHSNPSKHGIVEWGWGGGLECLQS